MDCTDGRQRAREDLLGGLQRERCATHASVPLYQSSLIPIRNGCPHMHQSQPDIPKVESPHRSCYPRSSTSIPSPSWAPAEPSSSPSTGEQTARSSTTPFFNDWPQHLGSPAVRRGHIYTHISYVPPPARRSRPSPSISPGLRIPAHDPPMLKDPDPHLFHLIPAGARLRCLRACHEYAPAAGARAGQQRSTVVYGLVAWHLGT